eukprot:7829451-Pyramimonas_sp.AAC.2
MPCNALECLCQQPINQPFNQARGGGACRHASLNGASEIASRMRARPQCSANQPARQPTRRGPPTNQPEPWAQPKPWALRGPPSAFEPPLHKIPLGPGGAAIAA